MGWLEGVWDGNSMLKFQHTYADFPAGKSPNADISAHMLERQHNEYYKLKNCRWWISDKNGIPLSGNLRSVPGNILGVWECQVLSEEKTKIRFRHSNIARETQNEFF